MTVGAVELSRRRWAAFRASGRTHPGTSHLPLDFQSPPVHHTAKIGEFEMTGPGPSEGSPCSGGSPALVAPPFHPGASPAHGRQHYPDSAIRIIASLWCRRARPTVAGRLKSDRARLRDSLGQPFVIENRPAPAA